MTSLFSLPPSFVRATLAVASLLSLPACKSTTGAAGSNSDSLYASNYANDGGYRPYGSGGSVQTSPAPAPTGSSAYGRSVPPPPPGYEMPKEEEFHSPPASTTSSSSSGSSTKKSTASTAKKKTSTSATKKKSASPRTHTVVKGDTLYGLALRHKTTVAKIKAASGISSDKLSIGQKLRIP